MSGVGLRQVGSIDLIDLDILSRALGREFLPYPFMLTRPSRFSTQTEFDEYARTVPDRFGSGDLYIFQRCCAAYLYADIRVECHVQYISSDTASTRALACRVADTGYLARQRADEDIIDVYELSPYDLGPAIADSVVLTKPGARPEIVVPEYKSRFGNAYATESFSVRSAAATSTASEVRRADVTAFAKVQSHWRPTKRWGFDRGKPAVLWVQIQDDGEYVYASDYSVARPMNRQILAERTDKLIAEDVKALRDFRSD